MLTAWSLLLASSSLLYLISPRLPHWQVTSLTLKSFWLSISSSNRHRYYITINADILCSITIATSRGLSVEMYDSVIDVAYPDWSGELHWIGVLDRGDADECNTHNKCRNDDVSNVNSLTFHPHSHNLVVNNTLRLQNVQITTYTYLLYNIIKSMIVWGSDVGKDENSPANTIEVVSSAAVHIKTMGNPLLPLTVGLVCINYLSFQTWPVQIVDRVCSIEFVQARWANLYEKSVDLRDIVSSRYHFDNSGSVFAVGSTAEHEYRDCVEDNGDNGANVHELLMPWLVV